MTEVSNQEANYWGQGFDKSDENYYYSTNYDSEFLYLMTYNLKSGKRSLVYKTNWDVTRSSLSKNDKYRVVTVNQDAQNKLVVKRTKDDFDVSFKGLDEMNINTLTMKVCKTSVEHQTLLRYIWIQYGIRRIKVLQI